MALGPWRLLRSVASWLRRTVPATSHATGGASVVSYRADNVTAQRLRQLPDADWPGTATMRELSATEDALRGGLAQLSGLQYPNQALAARADALLFEVGGFLSRDGRFVAFVCDWPRNWLESEVQLRGVGDHAKWLTDRVLGIVHDVSQVEDAVRMLDALHARYSSASPDAWRRVLDAFDLTHDVVRLDTTAAIASYQVRLQLATQALEDSARQSHAALASFVSTIESDVSGSYRRPAGSTDEAELARLSTAIRVDCTERGAVAGLVLSDACTTHLGRLAQPTDRRLRTAVLKHLGVVPVKAILYWAKLHYALPKGDPRTIKRTRAKKAL